ncbi:cytochrome P450 [Hyalangium rubrum]|uniref:Cytochrome P450 n=1 Tax=Hyalangium rubrum TaxID=3103134 RepID=A0ABU5HFB0_9BACT|nr:cytochrome P450 [Hyalangium sp. s54d21]MDY7232159.1 cytochrome P450 [Hyalangium sp. s54d21]
MRTEETTPAAEPVGPLSGPLKIPLVGRPLRLAGFFSDPVRSLLRIRERYGKLSAIQQGDARMVFAFSPELNREVLASTDRFCVRSLAENAPKTSALYRLRTHLLGLNGDDHRKARRLVSSAFTRPRVEAYREDMAALADKLFERWRLGEVIDVEREMQQLALWVVSHTVYGVSPTDANLGLGLRIKQIVQGLFSPVAMLLPHDLPGSPYRTLLRRAEAVEQELLALIAKKRTQPGEHRDALAALVHARGEDGAPFTDEELAGHTFLLFFGGYDTTANALGWTLLLLALHPRVLHDVQDELTVLQGAPPTHEQLAALPLLDAVVKESLRLLSPVAFTARSAARGATLGGHAIPERADVFISPLATHRLPEFYEHPNRFLPERWLKGEPPSPWAYLPFGAGPHVCVGASLAALEIRITLAMLLQRFTLLPPDGARIDHQVQATLSTKAGMPMRVLARQRVASPPRIEGDIRELFEAPVGT